MARFPPLASVYTSKYAHRNVQCAKTDTKSTASGDKVVTLWVQSLHFTKLRFFFERWTIADAVLEVEPLDPLSDALPSPVTSNVVVLAVFFLLLLLVFNFIAHHVPYSGDISSLCLPAVRRQYFRRKISTTKLWNMQEPAESWSNIKRPQTVRPALDGGCARPIWVKPRSNCSVKGVCVATRPTMRECFEQTPLRGVNQLLPAYEGVKCRQWRVR